MSAIKTNLGSSILKFTFTDEDDEIIASFRLNPGDLKLIQRAEEMSDFFKNISNNAPENATIETALKYNAEIEEKMCYLLGYDARQSLFGTIPAMTILEDGSIFIVLVWEKIASAVAPAAQKRKEALEKAVNKHTAKYR